MLVKYNFVPVKAIKSQLGGFILSDNMENDQVYEYVKFNIIDNIIV